MGNQTTAKQLLGEEKSYSHCRFCQQLSEHAKVLDGCCIACFLKEGLTIRKEYSNSHNEGSWKGRNLGD